MKVPQMCAARSAPFLFAVLAVLSSHATADEYTTLIDKHLPLIARTEAETQRINAVTAPTTDFSSAEAFEEMSAGAATVRARENRDAFSQPSANMGFERELDFKVGNGLFRKLWVSAPSSTLASDGLGPLFNARSCQRCHIKDGRGHPPENPEDNAVSMFLRISVPGGETHGIKGYHATQEHPGLWRTVAGFQPGRTARRIPS